MRLRTYYGGFNLKKFRKYLKSSLKRNIDFTSSLLLLLECRLDILFLKLNLVKSLQEVKFFIKSGSIYINNKLITNYKEQLYLNDVITIKNKEKYYDFILERLYKRRILFNYPRYIEANYEIMKFILIFYPKIRDLSTPLKNDLHILRKIF